MLLLLRMLGWAAAVLLAVTGVRAFAEESECTASVCQDGSWPTMDIAAPPMELEQHAESAVIVEMVGSHLFTEGTVAGLEPTLHLHQVAKLDEVFDQAQEP